MQWTIDGFALEGSGHAMQDLWGSAGDTVWVIDGATAPTTEQNTWVERWVPRLSEALAVAVNEAPQASLTDTLEAAIHAAILDEASLPGEGWHPSGTVAMARTHPNHLSTLVLCDAGVLVREASGAFDLVQDNAIEVIFAEQRAAYRAAREAGDTAKTQAIAAQWVRDVDHWRNRDDGFWVAGRDPQAAHHAFVGEYPEATGVILMSDGVCNEVESALGGPAEAWSRLTTNLASTSTDLRAEVLQRDSVVDDFTAVVCRRETA